MSFFRRKPSASPAIEWLIVGLGNPGGEYRGTRHNVGFALIDRLAAKHGIRLIRGKHKAQIGTGVIGGLNVSLVKPLTFMNLSGQSVGPLARDAKVPPSNVLIVSDDLDLPLGKIRYRAKGSAGGHNGHKSIQAALQTLEYPRIRIGIGGPDRDTIDHVLSAFRPDEKDIVDSALVAAIEVSEALLADGEEAALRIVERYNKLFKKEEE